MKEILTNFINHKSLYFTSISIGTIFTTIINFFIKHTPEEMLGISISLWLLAIGINLIDIHTGIKADTKRKADKGLKFTFESSKGWRALEKICVFSIIIAFVYFSEKEIIRLNFPMIIANIFLAIKFIMFFYTVLIEIQSIGENQFTRYGKKEKIFILLDDIIEIINVGIKDKIKDLINK